jgi:hypothetical protein
MLILNGIPDLDNEVFHVDLSGFGPGGGFISKCISSSDKFQYITQACSP